MTMISTIYYCGQESLRRNGVAIIVNKRVRNAVLGCNLKNDRMISVHFQGKPFNITVIQAYAPTSNAEEAEVEWFYEDLQDLLEHPEKLSFSLLEWEKVVCVTLGLSLFCFQGQGLELVGSVLTSLTQSQRGEVLYPSDISSA